MNLVGLDKAIWYLHLNANSIWGGNLEETCPMDRDLEYYVPDYTLDHLD